MDFTVKQLSKKLNISRTNVERRMSSIYKFRDKYAKRLGHKLIINEDGYKALLHFKNMKRPFKSDNSQPTENNSSVTVLDTKIESLAKLLDSEREHNKQLQNIIQKSQKSIDHSNSSQKRLEQLLDQQQQLQLTTEKQNNKLRSQITKLRGPVQSNASKVVSMHNHQKPHKKGFWSRFFGN